MTVEFTPWPKIGRIKTNCIITEKLDGTNAAVLVVILGDDAALSDPNVVAVVGDAAIYAQSRNRFITPDADNYGFAGWVRSNAEELAGLGEGIHFGEWWGLGIQRAYGLTEKRFSLFNTARPAETLPACVSQVPVLYSGPFSSDAVDLAMGRLSAEGSWAAPGFARPEGVVVYLPATRSRFKATFDASGGKWTEAA